MLEVCSNCDKEYSLCYWVPNEMWNEVSGFHHGEGLLCITCFDALAKKKKITAFLRWSVEVL